MRVEKRHLTPNICQDCDQELYDTQACFALVTVALQVQNMKYNQPVGRHVAGQFEVTQPYIVFVDIDFSTSK